VTLRLTLRPFNPELHTFFEPVHVVPARLTRSQALVSNHTNSIIGVAIGQRIFVIKETLNWKVPYCVLGGRDNTAYMLNHRQFIVG
jgi:hypothetical protein